MAKRRARKNVARPASSPGSNLSGAGAEGSKIRNNEEVTKQQEIEKQEESRRLEVERQSAAIRAICEVETEHLLTGLRLLRSYFDEEQRQTPVLQFFEENLPDLSLLRDEKDGQIEVHWKEKDGKIPMRNAGQSADASLLHQLYRNCFASVATAGVEFPGNAVETGLLSAGSIGTMDLDASDTLMMGLPDIFQTPGVSSSKLSVGTTPKSSRLPKRGEMLLSVHGSPLGVYQEDTMKAINESGEGDDT